MKYSLQAINFLSLAHPTQPSYKLGMLSIAFLLVLALFLPANMNATPLDLDGVESTTLTTKQLTIRNDGNCTVRVYHWLATGDVFHEELSAGNSWSVDTETGQMWRVINTNQDWENLEYDEHYEVGTNRRQTWTIEPTYCESAASRCNAVLEHFSAVSETACNANDGQIITDPHINAGTLRRFDYY